MEFVLRIEMKILFLKSKKDCNVKPDVLLYKTEHPKKLIVQHFPQGVFQLCDALLCH